MKRSNGITESGMKEMKKLNRANMALSKASAMYDIQMYQNTHVLGPACPQSKLIFGQNTVTHFHAAANTYSHHLLLLDAVKYILKPELLLLTPNTQLRIQNPQTKKRDLIGTLVNFEYLVNTGTKRIWQNHHFVKPVVIKAFLPIHQPDQATPCPVTLLASAFPVKPNWYVKLLWVCCS
jgi:hypothetical protein